MHALAQIRDISVAVNVEERVGDGGQAWPPEPVHTQRKAGQRASVVETPRIWEYCLISALVIELIEVRGLVHGVDQPVFGDRRGLILRELGDAVTLGALR